LWRANVIVHPDVYDRDRLAIRGEPFLWVKGKLAKDDGTLNVIAEAVQGLGIRRSAAFRLLRSLRAVAPDSKLWRLKTAES